MLYPRDMLNKYKHDQIPIRCSKEKSIDVPNSVNNT